MGVMLRRPLRWWNAWTAAARGSIALLPLR
jgi:hypothetical protein